jgi:hypothetical protein
MYKLLITAMTACGLAMNLAAAGNVSPWDKNQKELKSSARCPIKYRAVFDREREMFGYNPRFQPGIITFTPKNEPVMGAGVYPGLKPGSNGTPYPKAFMAEKSYIQKLGIDGKWQGITSQIGAIRKRLSLDAVDKLYVYKGERIPDSVEFDSQGWAYTLAKVKYIKGGRLHFATFLLYSLDGMKNWIALPLKGSNARLEPYRPNSDTSKPPVITINSKNVCLYIPKKSSGKLNLGKPVEIASAKLKPLLSGVMAGAGNQCVTTKGKTFIAFMSNVPSPKYKGSLQYVTAYDHKTGKVAAPVLLGSTGHRVDGHNSPVIDIDSRGYVYVLGGAHWHSFKLWKSNKPYSVVSGWSKPEAVGAENDNDWSRNGLTYPGFVIDKKGVMHLVARGRSRKLMDADPQNHKNPRYGKRLNYSMVYLRKKPGKRWERRRDLTVPKWSPYSNWYHKIAIDRKGNLYVTYYYIALRICRVPSAAKAYLDKWPQDAVNGKLIPKNVKAHDPVLITSQDGGDTWFIAQTKDLQKNITKK